MAQHDLIIDNASGATVRSDLNNALAALGSTMKGATAPSAPLAGMLWIEDDNPSATRWTLKVYDGADWISVGIIDVTANTFEPAGSGAGGRTVLAAADAAAARTAIGATTVGNALIIAADAAAGRSAIGAAPLPITATGVGQVALLNPGTANDLVLPSSGTWVYFFELYSTTTGATVFTQGVGIAAGGTTIGLGSANNAFIGWAWRVS